MCGYENPEFPKKNKKKILLQLVFSISSTQGKKEDKKVICFLSTRKNRKNQRTKLSGSRLQRRVPTCLCWSLHPK